jgi:hypothetical protein
MTRNSISVLIAAAALLAAPVALRPGAHSAANAYARNLGRGEIVGQVVHRTGPFDRHLQVKVNGQEWTLHVDKKVPVMQGKEERSVHDIHDGTYVRAIGTRIGVTRLKPDRLYIVGDRLAMARARYPRQGYFASYAGYRSRYRR